MKTLRYISAVLLCGMASTLAGRSAVTAAKRPVFREMALPIVRLTVDSLEAVTRTDSRAAVLEVFEEGDTTAAPSGRYECMVHYRGATASQQAKKSFAVALKDESGEDLDANLLDIRSTDKWILDAMAVDKSRMRNRVCFDLWNEASHLRSADMLRNGTKGVLVELYLNGGYNGLYCLSDKVNRKLLGLKKLKGDDEAAAAAGGLRGVLYKCSRGDMPNHLLRHTSADVDDLAWGDWDLEYPELPNSTVAWEPLRQLIDFTDQIDTDSAYVADYLDTYFCLENMVDFALFIQTFCLVDNVMHNTYLSCENIHSDARLWITPWDLDGSFGRDGVANWLGRTGAPWLVFLQAAPFRKFVDGHAPVLFDKMAARWKELRDSTYSVEHVCSVIDGYGARMVAGGAWEREYKRWNGSSVDLDENLEEELTAMKTWYARNWEYLNNFYDPINALPAVCIDGAADADDAIYLPDGRRVTAIPAGLYIRGGKKYIGRSAR